MLKICLMLLMVSSLLLISGCRQDVNVYGPNHALRVSAGSILSYSDVNDITIKYDGWYLSDRATEKILKAQMRSW